MTELVGDIPELLALSTQRLRQTCLVSCSYPLDMRLMGIVSKLANYLLSSSLILEPCLSTDALRCLFNQDTDPKIRGEIVESPHTQNTSRVVLCQFTPGISAAYLHPLENEYSCFFVERYMEIIRSGGGLQLALPLGGEILGQCDRHRGKPNFIVWIAEEESNLWALQQATPCQRCQSLWQSATHSLRA